MSASVEERPQRLSRTAQLGERVPHTVPRVTEFLRIRQIVERFGICDDTWRNWVKQGKAPAPVPNVPGHPRWSVRDIDDFGRGLYRHGGRACFASARRRR